jgi:hypothetical protein
MAPLQLTSQKEKQSFSYQSLFKAKMVGNIIDVKKGTANKAYAAILPLPSELWW